MTTESFNPDTGKWETAIPEPYYYGVLEWLIKRLTGWRDEHGRKACVIWPWEF